MAQTITANELKTKGVTILTDETADGSEVIITVRGKNKFVVLPIAKYNYLRECELEAALLEEDAAAAELAAEAQKQLEGKQQGKRWEDTKEFAECWAKNLEADQKERMKSFWREYNIRKDAGLYSE